MTIRHAKPEDIDEMLRIYCLAKEYMDKSGNPTQWKPGHPNRAVLETDIAKGNSYVCEENGQLHAAFALILGADPTYQVIEEGKWLEDSPYGTIHRLASDGQIKGIFAACVSFCQNICTHLRADTHHDNLTMQHLLVKNGFVQCGIIHIADGSPRIAYEKID